MIRFLTDRSPGQINYTTLPLPARTLENNAPHIIPLRDCVHTRADIRRPNALAAHDKKSDRFNDHHNKSRAGRAVSLEITLAQVVSRVRVKDGSPARKPRGCACRKHKVRNKYK